ncbi:ribosome maturation factor RimP [Eubacteriales bacterium OttesenSCG-928-A19]|nr:ribosome maturation factor RimP [Eubacteriales bacterium OttesenSCG-928-A19]
MAQRDIRGFVMPLSQKLADDMGYELVDAELVKEGPGRYLRIYLDKEGGFTLDDCERFHRAIQPKLEAVDYDFLEVSSPGLDRPLKTPRDFDRAIGQEIEAKLYKPVENRKAFAGILLAYDDETIRLETQAGERTLPRKAIAQVKPVLHFEEDEDEGADIQ